MLQFGAGSAPIKSGPTFISVGPERAALLGIAFALLFAARACTQNQGEGLSSAAMPPPRTARLRLACPPREPNRISLWTNCTGQTAAKFFNDQRQKHPRFKRRRLEQADQRFETFPDPFCNWIVWDRNEDDFAEVGTHRLRSLSEANAKAFCSLLNRLFSRS